MSKFITTLQPDCIFVFGSNLAGRHGAGAALQAYRSFGAEYGVGEGLTGRCYAFPTLDAQFLQRATHELIASRNRLYACCLKNLDKRFLLTKVGCGLGGYPEEYMRAFFTYAENHGIANLILPEDWR